MERLKILLMLVLIISSEITPTFSPFYAIEIKQLENKNCILSLLPEIQRSRKNNASKFNNARLRKDYFYIIVYYTTIGKILILELSKLQYNNMQLNLID